MAAPPKYRTDHPDAVVRRLEEVREQHAFSQRRMAESLGVPLRTYQKWVYATQRPRHGAVLLARAEAMLSPRRTNCWEAVRCGREPGGKEVGSAGPCPAAIDAMAHGTNGGMAAGRICWTVSGTFCGLEVEGTDSKRFISCLSCDFFFQVLQEEGLANFKLLLPGQTYTQPK